MIKSSLTIGLLTLLLLPTASHAQSSIESALDSIKGELQTQNIEVIDFSVDQGQWGALPREIVTLLINEEYESLGELAGEYEELFVGGTGLNAMRYQLGVLESQKTQTFNQAQEDQIQNEIDLLTNRIENTEDIVRTGASISLITYLPEGNDAALEELKNLLFREIDTFFGQSRWGNLSYPISEALRQEGDLWEEGEERNLSVLARLHQDQDGLRELLANVTYRNDQGERVLLSPAEVDQVMAQVQASQLEGIRQINEIVLSVVRFIRNLIGAMAILWITVAGVRMVTSDDETVITEQKRGILYAVVGLVVILLIERIIALLYGTPGAIRETLAPNEAFNAEIYGVVNFIRSVVGMIAVLYIVRAGFLSITAQGDEDKITQNRKGIVYIVIGLIIVAVNRVIIENLFITPLDQDNQITSSNIATIIDTVGLVLRFFLGFVGLIALGALVYGAARLILNYGGSDETITSSKAIIRNAIIGIIVIIAAFTIVSTLVTFR